MKVHFWSVCCFLSLLLASCQPDRDRVNVLMEFNRLESAFKKVPDTCRTAVYWYWISDQISKDGVVKDLEAMKKAGINRAFIGNVAIPAINGPFPKHRLFSDEWWEIMHTALKKATELGIEIGIFNGPGWSQSGGPWVEPEESMRYLATEKVVVEGPSSEQITFRNMQNSQTVKILAYPKIPEIREEWSIDKNIGDGLELVMRFPARRARTLILQTYSRVKATARIFAKVKGKYSFIKSFEIDRSNSNLNVGFDPYAPIVIALPDINSDEYKLELESAGVGEALVTLSSKAYVERYSEKSLAKMFQQPLPMWDEYLWDDQPATGIGEKVVNPSQVIDLTSNFSESGKLLWDVPDGKWEVVRYAMKSTGVTNAPATVDGTGLEVDKMSKKHLSSHFYAFLGEIMRRIPEEDRKCFKVAVMDSYETGGMNWTDDMEEIFINTYDYSPIPFLPVLNGEIIGNADISNRFLWDLRRLIANRVAYDYVKGLTEICHENNMTSWLENYGHWGFPAEFLQYGGEADEVSGEFWSEGDLGNIENRAASSCAHIYGKRKVWAESFTSGRKSFARYPYLLKKRGDRFFTEGINSNLLHVFIHQPSEDLFPGVNAWFGTEFNRKNTWFSHLHVFTDYLKRCNLMLQSGDYVADVAYFIGEDAPKMTGETNPELPYGYSFDYINADILRHHATVKDGCLVLESGMKYRVLVLPKLSTMRPRILLRLKHLVNEGLVVLGPEPSRSPSLVGYPDADGQVHELAGKLWNDKENVYSRYGKGRVYPDGTSLEEVFDDLRIGPDFKCTIPDSVLFIHRRAGSGDIYFLSNQTERSIRINAFFRVKGMQPELWNPLTGEVRYLPLFNEVRQGTEVPLVMEPYESSFIVFRSTDFKKNKERNFPSAESALAIAGPWKVDFSTDKGVAPEPMIMDKLASWTEMKSDTLRYFSGKAVYTTSFVVDRIPEGRSLYLDLGKVMVMAKIKVNGKYAGGVWTPPYRVPVTELLKTGSNQLEIEVVNNWKNRLIGDLNLPEEQRTTWTSVCSWNASSPLQESGLLGPVKLLTYRYHLK